MVNHAINIFFACGKKKHGAVEAHSSQAHKLTGSQAHKLSEMARYSFQKNEEETDVIRAMASRGSGLFPS